MKQTLRDKRKKAEKNRLVCETHESKVARLEDMLTECSTAKPDLPQKHLTEQRMAKLEQAGVHVSACSYNEGEDQLILHTVSDVNLYCLPLYSQHVLNSL